MLAAAVREGDSLDGDDPGDGFTLVGMVGIVDPPRPEAIESIEDCRRAGIRVKMITGDHIGTAEAIGRELGLGDGEELRSITGSELENASDEELEGDRADPRRVRPHLPGAQAAAGEGAAGAR